MTKSLKFVSLSINQTQGDPPIAVHVTLVEASLLVNLYNTFYFKPNKQITLITLTTIPRFQCQKIYLMSCTILLLKFYLKIKCKSHLNWEVTGVCITLVWTPNRLKRQCLWPVLKCRGYCDEVQAYVTGWSEAADVWEALKLLWEVVFIEHRVCTVFYHLQRHCTKHWCKLVDALRSREENTTHLL